MDYYIQTYDKLMINLWEECFDGATRGIFFNTWNEISFSDYMEVLLTNLSGNPPILRIKADDCVFQSYFPFLGWIRERVSGWKTGDIAKLLSDSGVYYVHRFVLSSFLTSGLADRLEEIILEELEWEKGRMLESVWKVFLYLFREKPLVIVIENLHKAPLSTFRLLHYIASHEQPVSFLFIFSIDDQNRAMSDEKDSIYHIITDSFTDSLVTVDFKPTSSREEAKKKNPEKDFDIKKGILDARNCFHFLALEECNQAINLSYEKWVISQDDIPIEMRFIMFHILGDVNYFRGNVDNALIHYFALLNLAQQENASFEMAQAYQKIGTLQLKKDDIESAETNAQKSLRLAEHLNDKMLCFYANLLTFMIEDKSRKQSISVWRESNQEILRLAKALHFENSLSYVYTNPYGVYGQYGDEDAQMHKKGIEIAQRFDNQYRLAAAFQTRGLIHAVKGDYEKVFELYRKSEEIKLKMGSPLELSYIYNGMGFYYYMSGDYQDARVNYYKALGYLKKVRDFHEIGMTFFNIAANYFLARNHKNAVKYMEKLLSLLAILNMTNLAYHSRFGMFCLLAVNYAKLGNFAKAYEYMVRIKVSRLKPFPVKNEEFFMYCLIKGLLSRHEGNFRRAERFFNKAEDYLERENDVIRYMECYFFYEQYQLYKQFQKQHKADEAIKKGKAACSNQRSGFYKQIYEGLAAGKEPAVTIYTGTDLLETDFDWIMESAHVEMNMINLHKKINDINFLNAFQSITGPSKWEMEHLIQKAIDLVHNSFLIENIYYHSLENGGWKEKYSRQFDTDNNFPIPAEAMDFFCNNQKEKFYLESGNIPGIHIPAVIISIPMMIKGKIKGHMLCLNRQKKDVFVMDDIQVLSIAAHQLALALEKIEQDKEIINKNKELHTAYSDLNAVYKILKDDLSLARRIQENILPTKISRISECDICVKYFPMTEVGGDIFDIHEVAPDYLRFFLADATGHGVQAALVTMIIRAEYEKVKNDIAKPSELLHKINREFINTYGSLEVFFSCVILDIDTAKRQIKYCSAGHPEQLFLTENELMELPVVGTIVGFRKDIVYETCELDYKPGNKILLFTDGLYEQYETEKYEFGPKRIKKLFFGKRELPIKKTVEEILLDVEKQTNGAPKKDDITVIGVQM